MTVFDFPVEWYELVVTQKYRLRSINDVFSGRGIKSASDTGTKLWLLDVTFAPQRGPVLQDMQAFFARLNGQAGLFRMADAARLRPYRDRSIAESVATFSDGSTFTDGSGFANGYLPPEVFVAEAAARNSNYLVLGGFPPSTANVLRRDDRLQIKPTGISGEVPNLYSAMYGGDSDSEGRVGVEISPRLRVAIAAGDTVSLRNASTVFRLATDDQAEIEISEAGVGTFGFSAVEALDMVP